MSLRTAPVAANRHDRLRAPSLVPRAGLAVAAGLAVWASLPPRGWWPLGMLAGGLLWLALDGARARRRVLLGLLAGLGWFAPALAWATGFSAPGYVVLVAVESLLLALVALVVSPDRWWAVPAGLTAFTALRDRFPLGGLPLGDLALGQVGSPLLPAVSWAGALGLAALASLAGTAAVVVVVRRRAAPLAALVALTLAVGLAPLAGGDRPGRALQVAVVQGGGPRGIPAVVADPAGVLTRQVSRSAQVPAGTDLVVWPENVVATEVPLLASPQAEVVAAVARRLAAPLVAGVTEPVPDGRFRNEAVVWNAAGRVVDRYDKVHRVPFGEYIPARGLFGKVADLSLVPADAVPGRGPGLLRSPLGPLGVTISYEVFFADRARAAVRAGGRLLLVPTNASSYTGDAVPAQEVAAARLRALETGRDVVQAAPTGYSAIITADGTVRRRGPLGAGALLVATVRARTGTTPYAAVGDLPYALAALAALTAAWLARRRGQPLGTRPIR